MRVQDATDKNDLVWMLAELYEKHGENVGDWPAGATRRLRAIARAWVKFGWYAKCTNAEHYFIGGITQVNRILLKIITNN